MTKVKRFKAEIWRPEGVGTASFVTMPFDVAEVWGSKARVAVKGTINGFEFRSSVMPYGGDHLLTINAGLRAGAGDVDVGDTVSLVLEPDDAPRLVDPPPELAKVLAMNAAARGVWEKLPPSHRKEYVAHIDAAKQSATKVRRAAKAAETLLTKGRLKG